MNNRQTKAAEPRDETPTTVTWTGPDHEIPTVGVGTAGESITLPAWMATQFVDRGWAKGPEAPKRAGGKRATQED